jgi:serine/threonine protein kinase
MATFPTAEACARRPRIGQYFHSARQNPYAVCVTPNQMQKLFGPKAAAGAMPVGVRQDEKYDKGDERRLSALGCGVFACVWPRPGNKVVKITNDRSDVLALAKANVAGVKGVPRLYKAYRLTSQNTSDRPVYGMIVERVIHKPPGYKNTECISEEVENGSTDPERVADRCCGWQPADFVRSERNQICRRMASELVPTINALTDLGISMRDLHEENVGVTKDGRWKIIDLGLSGQHAGMDPPDLQGALGRRRNRRWR